MGEIQMIATVKNLSIQTPVRALNSDFEKACLITTKPKSRSLEP